MLDFNNLNKEVEGICNEIKMFQYDPEFNSLSLPEKQKEINSLIERMYSLVEEKSELLEELDKIFLEDKEKYDRINKLWLGTINKTYADLYNNFKDGSLKSEIIDDHLIFTTVFKKTAKILYERNEHDNLGKKGIWKYSITAQDLAVYYAYQLYMLRYLFTKRAIELKNEINYYYHFADYKEEIFISGSLYGGSNFVNFLQENNDNEFINWIEAIDPDEIPNELDKHIRIYERQGGNKNDWYKHTKLIFSKDIKAQQKDTVLRWLNNNTEHVKHEETILQWKQYIRFEFYERLSEIEKKIEDKVSEWKEGNGKIECAAFCQLLFDKKYFVKGSTKRKSVNEYSISKFGNDVYIQLESGKKNDREKHKILLNKYFK
ncbi:MAG: hypothetical protein NTX08_05380 [Sphingobacteriales bacterium]|nr:hypothetical protein [Sphingobacteriales bacterium]